MRKKLFWWIAGATIILGLMWLLLSTYFDQVLPGIKNSSEFIERFNAGNSPDGIELDDTITDNSFCISNGIVCRIVPVIGDEDICFRVYSRERDGIVYAIRIDETVSVYSEPTRLIAINEYLYSAFFKYASKDEREHSVYELEPFTWTEDSFSVFFLDYRYLNRLSFGDVTNKTGLQVRTVIYSRLSHGYTRAFTYPN